MITKDTVNWRVTSADGHVSETMGDVIAEHFIEVSVNGRPAFSLSCTPEHLTELVVGSLYTRRLIGGIDDIVSLSVSEDGTVAEAQLKGASPYLDTVRELAHLPEVRIDTEAVFDLIKRFSEDGILHKSTGGAHCCYIRFGNGSTSSFEDIGRHNALDKAVGYMLLMKEKPEQCMLFTTGRLAEDMVMKTIAAGVPVIVSKAVPTDKALEQAEKYGLKTICKAWPDSFAEPVRV